LRDPASRRHDHARGGRRLSQGRRGDLQAAGGTGSLRGVPVHADRQDPAPRAHPRRAGPARAMSPHLSDSRRALVLPPTDTTRWRAKGKLMRNIALAITAAVVAGCATTPATPPYSTMSVAGLRTGVIVGEAECAREPSAVWVAAPHADGAVEGACIRYYAAGL